MSAPIPGLDLANNIITKRIALLGDMYSGIKYKEGRCYKSFYQYIVPQEEEYLSPYFMKMLAGRPFSEYQNSLLVPATDRLQPVYLEGVKLNKDQMWRQILAKNNPLISFFVHLIIIFQPF